MATMSIHISLCLERDQLHRYFDTVIGHGQSLPLMDLSLNANDIAMHRKLILMPRSESVKVLSRDYWDWSNI